MARVAMLSFGLAVTTGIIYAWLLGDLAAPVAPIGIPWLVVAIGFCLVDLKVIEVHFRRESHAFSLYELPAIIGLFTLPPGEYLLAVGVGALLALGATLRTAPIKVVFNVANYLFLAAVSLVVFRALATVGGPPGLEDFIAAFAASLIACVLGALTIAAAITWSGGAPQFEKLPEMLQFGALVAVANTSIALLAMTLMWASPGALWLLILPIGTLFLAYRAWVSEREKHERLELVYQSSRILQHSPEIDTALLALLEHARAMFRAELAEVVLDPNGDGRGVLRTTSVEGLAAEPIESIDGLNLEPEVRRQLDARRAGFVRMHRTPGGRETPIKQAMVAPLTGESGVIGIITVANRLTEGTAFGSDDLLLLETIANQAAVALENGQLEQSLAELSHLKEQLRYQAYHDPLTDLPNRTAFGEAATARIAGETMGQARTVVLLLDLDDFKAVNDTLGHAAGDDLLVMVAERIRGCLRDDDVAARLGGDEFAILMRDEPSLERATGVARRLIAALSSSFPVRGNDVVVGVSIGIVMSTGANQTADELLGNADVAMYTAKAEGRRRFAVFDPTHHAEVIARHELSGQLVHGIARGEMVVHHQPIVELVAGRVVGMEALVRWRHPVRGLIQPDEFINLAEESGAIRALGSVVLDTAAREIGLWNAANPDAAPAFVTVNVSALQLQQPDFLEEVERALSDANLDPSRLVLEITESAMFRDTAATIAKLEALRERGVRIAIDDFGTGYASLTYLRRFPVDIIKIAHEFIGSADADTPEWAFTGAILALGAALGLTVIAEGIEDAGQHARLLALGCTLGQGFYFAEPTTISAMLDGEPHEPVGAAASASRGTAALLAD
ncbi:MAG TPA: EAL domain-containing protein [Candidatus Limnocylindria bacterium]|nr:EAL domain-containing protein [Candidatus Limnocylindria bacterium]